MPFLSCFAVLAAVSFSSVLCTPNLIKIDERISHVEQLAIDAEVQKLLYQRDLATSIAGENTPVWIAKWSDAKKTVVYEKCRKGIINRAMNQWKWSNFRGLTTRPRRFSDKNPYIVNEAADIFRSLSERINGFITTFLNPTQYNDTSNVHRPLILVTMDYAESTWPTTNGDLDKLILERILYALAFWNGVDLQLRHLQNPRVRLQIAGIIINQHKNATPYVYKNEGILGLDMAKAFASMVSYWREPTKNKVNFPTSGYDIVATMTDSTKGWNFFSQIDSMSTSGALKCSNDSNLGIMLFTDNFAFKGIQLAVREMANVLGPKHNTTVRECRENSTNVLAPGSRPGRIWSTCSLKQISGALQEKGHCFGKQFIEAPGKPMKNILPGKLLEPSARCRAYGWVDGNVCSEYSTCADMYCSNNHIISRCTSIGAALDGTDCGNGMMCLDAKCVTNSTML